MGLLSALGLPQPKHAPTMKGTPAALHSKPTSGAKAAVPAGKPQEIEVVGSDKAVWDNREVSEDEGDAWIAGGGGVPNPTTQLKKPKEGGDPPAKGGSGGTLLIPVSLSIPVGKKYKYVELEKIKIEGELKLAHPGDPGVVNNPGVIGVPISKKTIAPGKKYEVDLQKLKDLVMGDLEKSSQQSSVKVTPKLEFKITTEDANVAVGINITNGWYTFSTKFVAVAKDKGKAFEFAKVDVSPFGCQLKPREFELGGIKGMVSGKITVTLVLKPAWDVIAAELGEKIGRPVLNTLATVLTAEVAIAAGFTAIAAAQIFAFVKSVSEIQDIKAWHAAADKGWESFRSGYCSVYGVKVPDGGAGDWRRAGVQAGDSDLKKRLENSRKRYEAGGGKWDATVEREVVDMTKADLDRNKLLLLVEKNHRRAVVKNFLDAYEQGHHDDYQFDINLRALRTRLGA